MGIYENLEPALAKALEAEKHAKLCRGHLMEAEHDITDLIGRSEGKDRDDCKELRSRLRLLRSWCDRQCQRTGDAGYKARMEALSDRKIGWKYPGRQSKDLTMEVTDFMLGRRNALVQRQGDGSELLLMDLYREFGLPCAMPGTSWTFQRLYPDEVYRFMHGGRDHRSKGRVWLPHSAYEHPSNIGLDHHVLLERALVTNPYVSWRERMDSIEGEIPDELIVLHTKEHLYFTGTDTFVILWKEDWPGLEPETAFKLYGGYEVMH